MTTDVASVEELGRRRRALGVHSGRFAEHLGVNRVVYSRWENGREPMPAARRAQLEAILAEYERVGAWVESVWGAPA